MASPEKIYRRLPGRGVSALQHVRLYQGPDHILQVASTGYSESYKRFYFRDIQAVTIQKTVWGKVWNGVWGFLFAVFALPAIGMSRDMAIVMWIIAGFFGVGLLVNVLIGPSCACHIRTAVQVERLRGLGRIKASRRLLRRLRPLIDSAQGASSPEEVMARLRPSPSPATYSGDAPPVISETPAAETLKPITPEVSPESFL